MSLYFRQSVLEADTVELTALGYDVRTLHAAEWKTADDFHTAAQRDLGFPDHYGRNLTAFNDCVSDLAVSDAGGLLIRFLRLDAFAARCRPVAEAVLDTLGAQARLHLLFGRRVLVAVQSGDPRIEFPNVGSTPVGWNPREWLDANRQ